MSKLLVALLICVCCISAGTNFWLWHIREIEKIKQEQVSNLLQEIRQETVVGLVKQLLMELEQKREVNIVDGSKTIVLVEKGAENK